MNNDKKNTVKIIYCAKILKTQKSEKRDKKMKQLKIRKWTKIIKFLEAYPLQGPQDSY